MVSINFIYYTLQRYIKEVLQKNFFATKKQQQKKITAPTTLIT